MVQRHTTWMVIEHKALSYTDKLKAHELPSLGSRMERIDMVTLYKFLKGFDKVNCDRIVDRGGSKPRGLGVKFRTRMATADNNILILLEERSLEMELTGI